MRCKIHLFALVALVFACGAAAQAQDMRVDRLELLDAGFYETAKTTVTGTTPSAGAVTGTVKELGEVKLSPEAPESSARVGIGFGVRFRSFGERNGERAALRSVWKIPAPGINNPSTGNTYRQSVSDFTTTTEWDPGTVVTTNHHGDGGVGTTYLNTSTFLGRKTQLTYIVREFIPGERIRLRGENKTVIAVDTMTFRSIDAGTEVTYTAEFTFKGPSRLLAPLLRPAFERLGQQAQTGMRKALNQL